jgi:class 3 adenylate cyclase/tetratricopeptide (TPR) repeat protein
LPPNARFCPNCGAPVAVPPAAERKIVTVVFVDMIGSTELAARLDPERYREVIAAFHGMVTEEVVGLRGRAEGFIGDAVLGVFGLPVSHDDDAVRGIRAALAIVARAERLGEELGMPLPTRVRAGVNTGPVAVGTATDQSIVIGAEVNIGSRLQQAAGPGEVLVGATTHQLAQDVEFGELREVAAKGLDGAIPAWPVLRLAPRSTRASIPFVDRRRELTLLLDTFERVEERERAHLVTLLGEPGIGKSRLIDEFLAGLPEGVKVLAGRASQFEEGGALGPIADIVYREIGEEPGAPPERLMPGLLELARGSTDDPREAGRTAERLAALIGVGGEIGGDRRYRAAEMRQGFATLLEGFAAHSPVVLVLEQLHDADPLLLDTIESLLRDARRLPVLAVCEARWEFPHERPGWAGGIADALTLWVERLSPDDATQLAVEAGDLDRDLAERVAAHAGGNPLFIVEITGMLLHEGRDLPSGPGPSAQLLPATVQAVVASRIDHLSEGTRELVRRASVFPRGTFDLSELELVVEPRTELLEEAEDEELLMPDDERPNVWRFRADVLREVAYESLAKRERQRLHLRVANRLSEDPETAARYPRSIAYHLEQATLAARDINPGDRSIAERAIDALAAAGHLARRGTEPRAAVDLYERALALAGPEDRWGPREAWILSALGEARYWLGDFDLAHTALRQALEIDGDSDKVVAHASRFLADIMLSVRGDPDAAKGLFDRALEAARRLENPAALSRTLLMAAWEPFWHDDFARARELFAEALEVARSRESRDGWAEVRALVGLASVTHNDGDERDALDLAFEALAIAEGSGQEFTTAVARERVAASLRNLLRLEEALAYADRAVGTYRELGARWELASALGDRGVIHRLAGRLEEAEADLQEALVLCRELDERTLVSWTAAELARVQAARGDRVAARRTLDDPVARASDDANTRTDLLTAEATLALAQGDPDTALQRSLASIDEQRAAGPAGNGLAAQIWWTARLFGDEAAGGPDVVRGARERLESHAWFQALREPDLAPASRAHAPGAPAAGATA